MTVAFEASLPLYRRLWIYQAERIPLGKTALLLAVFSAASINVSALLAGRELPGALAYCVAFCVVFVFFFQLRACDEVKDGEDDARYRPERPIPRGLVTLRTIVWIALVMVPVAAGLTFYLHGPLIVLVGLVWLWMGLMAFEFFVPDWLKARPILYLVSHMAIMPLIDLFLTASEWLPADGAPPPGLFLFLFLSFLNGCVLEIGRKIYAPENEREGVETYSALWGLNRAVSVWLAVLVLAFGFLALVGIWTEHLALTILPGAAMLIYCVTIAFQIRRSPDSAVQAKIDTAAGLWVFTCYTASGLLPILVSMLAVWSAP